MLTRRERLYKIRGFVAGLTGPRKRAFNTWAGALVEAALKRRALASFTRQSEVRALNKWRQFADERRAQMQKMHRPPPALRRSSSALSTSGKRTRPSTGCASGLWRAAPRRLKRG